ncbi:MAG: DUF485 domain-containing protein [Sterolibacteriaceae bacterium]|mgnify:FL=1|nr:DUF485 domain-containing protein [Sterolibacteriaceae bacterium]MBK9085156.1 DUF485 domain-containing protein [Sterolibacteriaceae bacterium]
MAQVDYSEIARHTKFRELARKKVRFLVGWWLFSTIFYFGLPIWAGNTTLQSDVGNMKVIGNVPLLYLYALAQYALSIAIALYYTYWANKYADRLTEELLRDLRTKP